jgi:AraC-like DNA-binding protein
MDKKCADDLDLIASDRSPAFALARDFAGGIVVPAHSHPVGQLLHALTGVILAETPGKAWAIPPGRALWIPANTNHQFRTIGAARVRTLYMATEVSGEMPAGPQVLRISTLVRELIVRAEADGRNGTSKRVQSLLIPLLMAELADAIMEALSVPWPTSPAMRAFARKASDHGSAKASDIAATLAISTKTLARKFKRETGMPPVRWRRHAKMLAAIAHLREGRPITEIAHSLGYNSSASFAAAFKRCFGMTPSQSRNDVDR